MSLVVAVTAPPAVRFPLVVLMLFALIEPLAAIEPAEIIPVVEVMFPAERSPPTWMSLTVARSLPPRRFRFWWTMIDFGRSDELDVREPPETVTTPPTEIELPVTSPFWTVRSPLAISEVKEL